MKTKNEKFNHKINEMNYKSFTNIVIVCETSRTVFKYNFKIYKIKKHCKQ